MLYTKPALNANPMTFSRAMASVGGTQDSTAAPDDWFHFRFHFA